MSFCPACGARLDAAASFVQEFWVRDERDFLCWCAACRLLCTVAVSPRLVSHEPEH